MTASAQTDPYARSQGPIPPSVRDRITVQKGGESEERTTDLTVSSIFAAMDDMRDMAIMLRDANAAEIGDPKFLNGAANQLRRLCSQLGVEAERLDGNLTYLLQGDHENANH